MRRLALNAAVLVAALVILAALRWTTPSYDAITGPIPVTAKAGAPATGRTFAVEAGDVRFARKLRYTSYGLKRERDTGGVWAVMSATLAATTRTTTVSVVSWVSAKGLRYAQSQRVEGAAGLLTARRLQPGLPQKGVFVFEIPPDAAAGAKLYVSQLLDPRLDSQARIELPPQPGAASPLDEIDLDEATR